MLLKPCLQNRVTFLFLQPFADPPRERIWRSDEQCHRPPGRLLDDTAEERIAGEGRSVREEGIEVFTQDDVPVDASLSAAGHTRRRRRSVTHGGSSAPAGHGRDRSVSHVRQ